mmetsp:Transcript_6920/g.8370  ORF Transcript_6920/g.8370 Transcript_6920/m.8370 type:complete len:388 (+) Transcript_6920:177-1340(+)|eukprot:CAMPEP_0184019194 /NCGR_PEP_ID=MMETSP0954-20121128/8607_1 /TAXON_ID=627963 /ORGANISM="Aplanochytrium sp, Strain PBS07" /LENGTH=387 /DNA_ID=CAMNT_0026300815 /DNA_START=148 /DNA_END=1311 /DNA_ORIENTATION=-
MGKGKKKGKDVPKKNTQKIVEDKTFGLKNKNKSKKVQKYIQQVNNQAKGQRNTQAFAEAQAKRRKAEREAKKQAEKEMFALLGDAYQPKKKDMSKKSRAKLKEKEKAEKEKAAAKKKEQQERDFSIPIVTLKDVFQLDSKVVVERVCGIMEHKDNLASKTHDGQPCIFIRISDGSTLKPFPVMIVGETPTTFELKVDTAVDIRGAVAMVRGDKVVLELTKENNATITGCSPELTEHILEIKKTNDEIRAQGGIPIEQLIEEQRAALDTSKLTPVTKERFFAWKEKKKKAQEAEWEEKRKAAAKKGGKGLNVLSGRALFAYDASLFKDDDAALDNREYDEDEQKKGSETKKTDVLPNKEAIDNVTEELQENLYLDGDDDLDDLDDLED